MNQELFWKQLSFTPYQLDNRTYFMGTKGTCFRMDENETVFLLYSYDPDNSAAGEKIHRFYKIFDSDTALDLIAGFIRDFYDQPGQLPMSREILIYHEYVRTLIGREIKPEQLKNLCAFYYSLIKSDAGDQTLVSDCIDVIRIGRLAEARYIDPELHQLLLKTPDLYYDFLLGVENIFEGEDEAEALLKEFLLRNPGADSIDIITVSSIIHANRKVDIPYLEKSIQLVHDNQIFTIRNIPEKGNEMTVEKNKFGWKIFTVGIRGNGYTIRQSGPVTLLDYRNICIGGSILSQEDGRAFLKAWGIEKDIYREELLKELLDYNGRIAAAAGFKDLYVVCSEADQTIVMSQGYHQEADNVLVKSLI